MTPKFRTPSEGTIALDARRLSELLSEMSTPQVHKTKQKSDSIVCKLFTCFEKLARYNWICVLIRIYAVCMQDRAPQNVEGQGQRGSWASFDLRSSQPDPLIAGLLDHVDAETIDELNEVQNSSNILSALIYLQTVDYSMNPFYAGKTSKRRAPTA